MEKKNFIHKDLSETCSAGESSRVYLTTDMSTGESELVIEKVITERYPTSDQEKVIDLYERLNCGGGRRLFTLEDIAHGNPKK